MKLKLLTKIAAAAILLTSTSWSSAQSLLYSNAIVSLNPAAYWPMHDKAAPVAADIETNYGSLGALGTAYYADWSEYNGAPANNEVLHQIPGALASNPEGGAYMIHTTTNTSFLVVPHTSPLTTLTPPFTLETWFVASNNNFGDIIGQDGTVLNAGNGNNLWGMRWAWGGLFQLYLGGGAGFTSPNSPSTFTNQWHHIVLTCSGTTNSATFQFYIDNVQVENDPPTIIKTDSWDPLVIGAGMWNINGEVRSTSMGLQEVAIYTNVLSTLDISNHFSLGTNASAGANAYFSAVLGDNPLLYYHMSSPAYLGYPAKNTWPVLQNYGLTITNGVYMPGVTPGGVTGPGFSGIITNAMPGNGMSAFADAGTNAAWNPTGHTPFSVTACFMGNPADSRLQSLAGRGDLSWHLRLDGTTGKVRFGTGAQASDLITTKIYNDGNWHQVTAVYTGTTNSIYVDGVLDTTATNGTAIVGTNLDVFLGGDPQYYLANNNTGAGMQLAGNLCEVAFFTNALTAAQVKTLITALGIPVSNVSQPVFSRVSGSDVVTASAVGSGPAYQWYSNTSSNYSGATMMTDGGGVSGSATASMTFVNLSDYYFVVVTNLNSSATSSIVQLPQVLTAVSAGEPIWNPISQTNICVIFSDVLDPGTAKNASNYTLNNGATVISAALGGADYAGSNEVVLTTSVLNTNLSYTLNIQNVNNYFGITQTPSPTSLTVGVYPANIALWVQANTGVSTNANGTVTSWTDLSGNGNNLQAATIFNMLEPVLTNNPLGLPVVHFVVTNTGSLNYGSGLFAYDSSSLEIVGNMSVIEVASFSVPGFGAGQGEVISKTGATVYNAFANANIPAPYDYNVSSTGPTILRGDGASAAGSYGTYKATVTISTNRTHIVAFSQIGNVVSHFLDGNVSGTAILGANGGGNYNMANCADQGQNFFVGNRGDYLKFNAEHFGGDLTELIVCASALSTNDMSLLQSYIASAYTLPIGTNSYPAITQQPVVSTNVYQSTTLTVPVGVSGNPLAYQWYSTNGVAVAGQTGATLAIPNIQTNNAYYLVATNIYGVATSANVAVNVLAVNMSPTNIVVAVTNNQMVLTWPMDHTGWQLQMQTNSLSVGLTTNWVKMTSSSTTNMVAVPINQANGSVFMRLVFPPQ
ncbi:MAG TPA: LamG-like jellyroll fold domain-containing protein [Candidatus Sulfotelmatobacter sp.]|jgi:hypothetical protein|nr:LamG-like jellyroll fold domain-containing protein [Candidatus Sulfotelmatobacter sp.]